MTDPRRERDGGRLTTPEPSPKQAARTRGTNRDFDESGEAANQGHGHPREERGTDGNGGRSGDDRSGSGGG